MIDISEATAQDYYWLAFGVTKYWDIDYCQERACKEPEYAYYFARLIPESDIEYCHQFMEDAGKEEIKKFILS